MAIQKFFSKRSPTLEKIDEKYSIPQKMKTGLSKTGSNNTFPFGILLKPVVERWLSFDTHAKNSEDNDTRKRHILSDKYTE